MSGQNIRTLLAAALAYARRLLAAALSAGQKEPRPLLEAGQEQVAVQVPANWDGLDEEHRLALIPNLTPADLRPVAKKRRSAGGLVAAHVLERHKPGPGATFCPRHSRTMDAKSREVEKRDLEKPVKTSTLLKLGEERDPLRGLGGIENNDTLYGSLDLLSLRSGSEMGSWLEKVIHRTRRLPSSERKVTIRYKAGGQDENARERRHVAGNEGPAHLPHLPWRAVPGWRAGPAGMPALPGCFRGREATAMTVDDELQCEQTNAARAELRRIVTDSWPPTDTPLAAFGPWAEYLGPIRQAFAERGVRAAQEACLALIRLHPPLGLLLADAWQPDPVAPAPRLRPRPKAGWTAAELLAADFPHAGWIVPGLLPAGLSTLAGRPKMGKSWLALQIACAVGAGGSVLDRAVEQGPVRYLALEDGPRRLQERLRAQQAPPGDVTFALEWPPLAAGGQDALRRAIERGKVRLVVVDTLSRALGRAGRLDPAGMALAIAALQDLCRATGAAILTTDHHRKPWAAWPTPSTIRAAWAPRARRPSSTPPWASTASGAGTTPPCTPPAGTCPRSSSTSAGTASAAPGSPWAKPARSAKRACRRPSWPPFASSTRWARSSTTNIARHLRKHKGNVSHELAELIQSGKVVKGPKDGRVVPYFLGGPVLPSYTQ